MRAATTLIIALLLFLGLPGCSTAKKATAKQETHEETAATFNQETAATETGAAYFDQATIEKILQRLNVVIDFERWDYDTGAPEGIPADSLPPSAATMHEGRQSDKPPNAGHEHADVAVPPPQKLQPHIGSAAGAEQYRAFPENHDSHLEGSIAKNSREKTKKLLDKFRPFGYNKEADFGGAEIL